MLQISIFSQRIKVQFVLLSFLFTSQMVFSQVGIGVPLGETPEATLDVRFDSSVAPGFLMPRVTSFPTPEPGETLADGLLVFLSSEYVDQNGVTYPSSYYVFIDGEWKSLAETAGIITPGGGAGGCTPTAICNTSFELELGCWYWVWNQSSVNYSSRNAYDGTYSLELEGMAGIGIFQTDLSTYNSVDISFWYVTERWENSDQLLLQYSLDGSNWTTLQSYDRSDNWVNASYTISDPSILTQNVQIRIFANTNNCQNCDWAYIDLTTIQGNCN